MFSQAFGLAIRDGSKYPRPFTTGALCLSKWLSIEELISSSIYNIVYSSIYNIYLQYLACGIYGEYFPRQLGSNYCFKLAAGNKGCMVIKFADCSLSDTPLLRSSFLTPLDEYTCILYDKENRGSVELKV